MNYLLKTAVVAGFCVALGACGSAPKKDLEFERLQAELKELQSEPMVEQYAPAELRAAQIAVRRLETSTSRDELERGHMSYLAQQQIGIARARASELFEKQQLLELQREKDQILLQASLQEAQRARAEAERLRLENIAREEEAERARKEVLEALAYSEQVEAESEQARAEAQAARELADSQTKQAELARQEAALAAAQADSLRRQLENLTARETDRGLMLTLGDVLFETGQSELKTESLANLDELVDFISKYPDRQVSIEGHTDDRGSASFNLDLSQRRAESVRDALIERGISSRRVQAVGLGEEFPVASNDHEFGRSQNRRVEIIVLKDGEN